MTIPTQEEALRALDILKLGRDVGNKQVATLRSYIESHTGEVVAWLHTLDNTDGIPGSLPLEILSKSPESPFAGGGYSHTYRVTSEPLYLHPASPVQPIALEWGRDALANDLLLNGRSIGAVVSDDDGGGWAYGLMPWHGVNTVTGFATEEEARSALEAAARQWLSIGDK